MVVETKTLVKLGNDCLDNQHIISFVLTKLNLTSICIHVDSSENIKKHYQRSLSAEKKINETTSIIKNSEKIRNDLLTIFDRLSSKENSSLEKLQQITVPDIQILNKKVNIHDGVIEVFVVSAFHTNTFNCISCLAFYFLFILYKCVNI